MRTPPYIQHDTINGHDKLDEKIKEMFHFNETLIEIGFLFLRLGFYPNTPSCCFWKKEFRCNFLDLVATLPISLQLS
jgi:hypothetical protein